VVVAHAAVAGFLIQLVGRAFPYFGWVGAVLAVIIVLLLLGFPVVVVLAWLFIKPKDPAKTSQWQRRHGKLGAAVAFVIIALVVISGFYAVRFSELRVERLAPIASTQTAKAAVTTAPSANTVIPAKSIAVLPFENLSNDPNNAYFVDGMQDLILTKLADISDLKVISSTSTAQYASHPEDLKTISRQLGVAALLEGSVQKSGNQVLITVQLFDARTDTQLWAQAYTRTLHNIFGVEGEVARSVASALDTKLSTAEARNLGAVPTANQAAYDLFLRAEYQARRSYTSYDLKSYQAAIPLYRQALEQDPNFALAYAKLSIAESGLAWFGGGGMDARRLSRQARTDAQHALKLQPSLAEAQLAMGFSDYWGRGDYVGALKAFGAVLTLRPNDAAALLAQGFVERKQGGFDAAKISLPEVSPHFLWAIQRVAR
jgi:TolB-like protein